MSHCFKGVDGFRLSGFCLEFPWQSRGQGIRWEAPADLVIEDCCFRNAISMAPTSVSFDPVRPLQESICVRKCLFTGGDVLIGGNARRAIVVMERNYFHRDAFIQSWEQKRLHKWVLRHNVSEAKLLQLWECEEIAALEVSNNTSPLESIRFLKSVPQQGVRIINNAFAYPAELALGAEKQQAATRNWEIAYNRYLEERGSALPTLPPAAKDRVELASYLAADPSQRDYLRVPSESDLANRAAAGDWPNYHGALEPGPAPAAGDWFTQLRERWALPVAQKPND